MSDLLRKRLCSKGKSISISSTITKLSGRELILGSGLLLAWISVKFFFLTSFSGLFTISGGLGSGLALVYIFLGARSIINYLQIEICTKFRWKTPLITSVLQPHT